MMYVTRQLGMTTYAQLIVTGKNMECGMQSNWHILVS